MPEAYRLALTVSGVSGLSLSQVADAVSLLLEQGAASLQSDADKADIADQFTDAHVALALTVEVVQPTWEEELLATQGLADADKHMNTLVWRVAACRGSQVTLAVDGDSGVYFWADVLKVAAHKPALIEYCVAGSHPAKAKQFFRFVSYTAASAEFARACKEGWQHAKP